MRKNITIFITGLLIGMVIGVILIYPGIYACTHHLNFFETWYNMIVPFH